MGRHHCHQNNAPDLSCQPNGGHSESLPPEKSSTHLSAERPFQIAHSEAPNFDLGPSPLEASRHGALLLVWEKRQHRIRALFSLRQCLPESSQLLAPSQSRACLPNFNMIEGRRRFFRKYWRVLQSTRGDIPEKLLKLWKISVDSESSS